MTRLTYTERLAAYRLNTRRAAIIAYRYPETRELAKEFYTRPDSRNFLTTAIFNVLIKKHYWIAHEFNAIACQCMIEPRG